MYKKEENILYGNTTLGVNILGISLPPPLSLKYKTKINV